MPGGFFGAGVIPGGVVLGNLLGKGGLFGPVFRPAAVVAAQLVTVAGAGPIPGGGGPGVGAFGWNNGDTGPCFGAGSITSGSVPVTSIGTPMAGIGDGNPVTVGGQNRVGFFVGFFGAPNQNAFASVTIIELGITLLTAAASHFDNGGGCGPDGFWEWDGLLGLVVGHTYSYKFT